MVVGANLVAQHEDVAVRKKDKYVELDVTVPTVKILKFIVMSEEDEVIRIER